MIDNYSNVLEELINKNFNIVNKSIDGHTCDCEKVIPFVVPHCDKLQLYVAVDIKSRIVYFCCKYTNGEKVGSNTEIIPEDLDYPFTFWLEEKIEERIRY